MGLKCVFKISKTELEMWENAGLQYSGRFINDRRFASQFEAKVSAIKLF